jgi:hypothetical protein
VLCCAPRRHRHPAAAADAAEAHLHHCQLQLLLLLGMQLNPALDLMLAVLGQVHLRPAIHTHHARSTSLIPKKQSSTFTILAWGYAPHGGGGLLVVVVVPCQRQATMPSNNKPWTAVCGLLLTHLGLHKVMYCSKYGVLMLLQYGHLGNGLDPC